MMIVLLPQVGYISSLEGIVVMGYMLVPFTVNSSHLNRDVKKGLKKKRLTFFQGRAIGLKGGGGWKTPETLFDFLDRRRGELASLFSLMILF